VLKTGCRWRDVPLAYGPPTTINNRYNRWSQRRIWQRIFEKMAAAGPIPEELSIDSSHVKEGAAAGATSAAPIADKRTVTPCFRPKAHQIGLDAR
jgi:transposase